MPARTISRCISGKLRIPALLQQCRRPQSTPRRSSSASSAEKDGELPPCEIRLRRVRLGEMGEDALDLQPRQRGDARDVLRRARDILERMAVKAEARHAGIDLDMHADRPAIGKLRRVCKGRDRLHHVVFGNGGVQLLRVIPSTSSSPRMPLREAAPPPPYRRRQNATRPRPKGGGRPRRRRARRRRPSRRPYHDPFFPRLAAEQAVIVFYVRQTDARFSPVFTS